MASLADIADTLSDALSGVTFKFGAEFISDNDAPPRVVMVPARDTFDTAQANRLTKPAEPRSRGTRWAGVMFHVWAAGDESSEDSYPHIRAVEALTDRLIIAMRDAAFGAYRLEEGELQLADTGHFGRVYVFGAKFALPIVPAESPTEQTTFTNVDELSGGIPNIPDAVEDPPPDPGP